MPDYHWLEIGLKVIWVFFVLAWGACLGSLINVLVYRLPLGMDVVSPTSRCPACETKLTWRENIPILGWVLLGGRCRFCKSKISAEYPLVELLVGVLWVGLFAIWYLVPPGMRVMDVPLGQLRPDWALSDAWDAWPRSTWPIFVAFLLLVASLVAMTLTDVKTFTIPLVLPWFITIAGVGLHVVAALIQSRGLARVSPGWAWAIPTPGGSTPSSATAWWWIGASLGSVLGLAIANALVYFKLIRRSFDDYAEWEKNAYPATAIEASRLPTGTETTEPASDRAGEHLVGENAGAGVGTVIRFTLVWLASICVLGMAGAFSTGVTKLPAWAGLLAGAIAGPILAALACREKTAADSPADDALSPASETSAPEMWIAYPHARREMLKELIFLTPAISLAVLGGWVGAMFAGAVPPLWLLVLVGSLMGYLIGGGVVWGIRIFGSLGFGKEAMGLGDVHLMAGVGAVAGWITASLAVPIAAVVGLYWFVISGLMNRPAGRAMPFGPYLAVASVLVIVGRPAVELGLNWLLATGVDTPRLTIP